MKRLVHYFSLFLMLNIGLRAQSNCSTPTVVTVCGTNSFLAETTTGAVNDRSAWQMSPGGFTTTLNGNDKVYEVNLPAGAQVLWVDISTVSPLRLIDTRANCSGNYSSMYAINSGCSRQTVHVSGFSKLYLWIDMATTTDISYDIHFSVVTGSTTFPRGVLQPSFSCRTPIFNSKFHLTYNGVNMTYPLVYSPLGAQGQACYKIFLKNPGTGMESIKRIRFTFGNDLQSPAPSTSSTPGFYAVGDWIASQPATNVIEYNFVSASGRGDYPPNGTTCAGYEFCFTFIPVSNNPSFTTTNYTWWGDGVGDYTIYNGCFSTGTCKTGMSCNSNSCSATGIGAGGVASGSGSTTDPFLPVHLTNFLASKHNNEVLLSWTTTAEQNSDRFEIEASKNGVDFGTIGSVNAAGNSNHLIQYSFTDSRTSDDIVYYRLKEVDTDGSIQYSSVISSGNSTSTQIRIFPNPASTKVSVQSSAGISGVSILDLSGNEIYSQPENNLNETEITLEQLNRGVYLLKIITEEETRMERLVVE